MKKRVLSILAVLALILTLMPAAFALDVGEGGNGEPSGLDPVQVASIEKLEEEIIKAKQAAVPAIIELQKDESNFEHTGDNKQITVDAADLTIRGENDADITISGPISFLVTGDNVTIENLTISSTATSSGTTSSTTDSVLEVNQGSSGTAIDSFTLKNVTISSANGYALGLHFIETVTLDGLNIPEHKHVGWGIILEATENVTVKDTTIKNADPEQDSLAISIWRDELNTNANVAVNITLEGENEINGLIYTQHPVDGSVINELTLDAGSSLKGNWIISNNHLDIKGDISADIRLEYEDFIGYFASLDTVASSLKALKISESIPPGSSELDGTVHLAAGKYNLSYTLELIGINLKGAGEGETIIRPATSFTWAPQPPGVLAPNLDDHPLIYTTGDVEISDLTISGSDTAGLIVEKHFRWDGIRSKGDSLKLNDVSLLDIRSPGGADPNLSGNQCGRGVVVETGTADIKDCTIKGFQKNGIDFYSDSTHTVTNTVIEGYGPTAAIAQNGIVVSAGTAAITDTVISKVFYTPESDESCGILSIGGTTTVSGESRVSEAELALAAAYGGVIDVEDGYFGGGLLTINEPTSSFLTITGGHYTANPAPYVADTHIAVASAESGYNYMVAEKAEGSAVDKVVDPGATNVPDSTVALPDGDNGALQNKLKGAQSSGLDADAGSAAQSTTSLTTDMEGRWDKAIDDNIIDDTDVSNPIVTVIQPGLDIAVTDYKNKQLTLDISAYYNLIATNSDNVDKIITDKDSAPNAVILNDKPIPLEVTVDVTIVLPIPDWYAEILEKGGTDNIFIKHAAKDGVHYYRAKYDAANTQELKPATLTFIITHGFSEFTVFSDDRMATVKYCDEDGDVDADIGTLNYTAANLDEKLPSSVKTGYTFVGWVFYFNSGDAVTPGTYSVMTSALLDALNGTPGIYAKPVFTSGPVFPGTPSGTHTITATAGHGGAVSPAEARVNQGANHTVTITPNEGYVVADVLVDGVSVGAVTSYTFEKVSTTHKLEAKFKLAFTDVSPDAWFYDAVAYAFDNGLMNGMSDTLFAPDVQTTRGMLITILWRLEGSPIPPAAEPFTDLISDWYTNAVLWGFQNGIVEGYIDGTFRPDANITREDMAVILRRYAEFKGYSTEISVELFNFTDMGEISGYAINAMRWAYEKGLITGRTETLLAPRGLTTRAELATVMMRFQKL